MKHFLKIISLTLLLVNLFNPSIIQAAVPNPDCVPKDPRYACLNISHDPNLSRTLLCKSGTLEYCCSSSRSACQTPGVSAGSGATINVRAGCASDSINTAIGCIPYKPSPFVEFFLKWFFGVVGGIAFLLIISAGYQIMTAQGDPQKMASGREVLTAAISGLIFIVFSVFLLNLIGYHILRLPGF